MHENLVIPRMANYVIVTVFLKTALKKEHFFKYWGRIAAPPLHIHFFMRIRIPRLRKKMPLSARNGWM
jgi:hypothetical protein